MGATLNKQLDLYREQSAEPWLQDHNEVMQNYSTADELDELCAFGMFVFERLKKHLRDCNASFKDTVLMRDGLGFWYEGTSRLCQIASEFVKNEDFNINNLNDLCAALSEASSMLSDLQEASEVIESVRTGTAVSMQDFLNEL